MAVVIVNSRQVSPVNSFLSLVDKFDHPTGRIVTQGLDFNDFFFYQDHLTNPTWRGEPSLIFSGTHKAGQEY